MNTHLTLTAELQSLISNIENTPTHLAELPIPEHPKFPQYDRFIRVLGIDIKSENEFVYFTYLQILRDAETGEEIKLNLPTPEWVVYADTWSYVRDADGQPIKLPLKPEIVDGKDINEGKTDFVKAPSYKYMIMLMRNKQARFFDLVETYLHAFVASKIDELNKV